MKNKFIITSLFVVLLSGCSTMRAVEMTPEQVQQKISTGEVVDVGDTVKIVTRNDEAHTFKVTAITDQQVSGEDIDIPIEEIVAIETKKFSAGRTAAAAGSTALLWIIIGALAFGGTLAL